MIGHAVPTTIEPSTKPSISSVYSAHGRTTFPACVFSNSTAASNCSRESSYGSVIPRSGLCAIRYIAASAMKIGES